MPNQFAAQWFPPVIRRMTSRAVGYNFIYRGPFPDWMSASASTDGHDQDVILTACRVQRAMSSTVRLPLNKSAPYRMTHLPMLTNKNCT